MEPTQVICQIKQLCESATKYTYDNALRQGREYLLILRELGVGAEQVYQPLYDYYKQLEDGMIRDCVADLLDFVVGWCSPQWVIWKNDGKQN